MNDRLWVVHVQSYTDEVWLGQGLVFEYFLDWILGVKVPTTEAKNAAVAQMNNK